MHLTEAEDMKKRWQEYTEVSPSIYGETVETVTDFIFGGLQNHCRWSL